MNSKISTAWQIAGADLGISVIAPYVAKTGSGELIRCEAYLQDFGSPTGAFALSHDATGTLGCELAEGLWCSILYEPYKAYARALIMETLNDWGWFGQIGTAPDWYAGAHMDPRATAPRLPEGPASD